VSENEILLCDVLLQGLHDVLAVIMWVVHCDLVAWENADESAQSVGFVLDYHSVCFVNELMSVVC